MSTALGPTRLLFASAALLSILTIAISPCVTAQTIGSAEPDELAAIDRVIEGYFKENRIPGALVAVASHGRIVHTLPYGLANVELGVPVTDSTVFEIGSISKQFVAAAVMLLVEENALGLNDPIHTHLAGLPSEWFGVTVQQLLTHTSGIPDYEEIASYDVYGSRLTPEDVIQIAHSRPMDFDPGTGFHYSNTGYFLLSRIVEQVEGHPLGEVLDTRIFGPLGMRQTRMADPEAIVPNRASGYWADKTGTLINRRAIETSSTLGAGGLLSSAHDMALWDEALRGDALLTPASKATMWTPVRLPDGSPTRWSWGGTVDYAFGWEVTPYRGVPMQTHSGQTAGFVAQFMRFPEHGIAIIAFMNKYDEGAWPPARAMADTIISGLGPVEN